MSLINLMHNGIYLAEGIAVVTNTIVLWLCTTEKNKDLKEYRNLLVLNFYYRWKLICKKNKPSVRELVGLFGIAFVSSATFLSLFGYCFLSTNWKYSDHSFLRSNPFIFNAENPNPTLVIGDLKSYSMLLLIGMTAVGNTLICSLIAFFTWDTYKTMSKLRSQMHVKTAKLHSQLNRMLMVQTAAVFTCALLPLGALVLAMITAVDYPGLGTGINLALSFIPVINPICTLYCVKRFRTRFFHTIWPFVHRSQVGGFDTSTIEPSKDATPMTIA
ncbi:hypothetical protein M3Y99_01707100 [Aphelenchoides fujianensis]|nr:hypothetical protein M3Y99_01707100 [Aphelenchoides fujianensis]